jgi:hypothetical protein
MLGNGWRGNWERSAVRELMGNGDKQGEAMRKWMGIEEDWKVGRGLKLEEACGDSEIDSMFK